METNVVRDLFAQNIQNEDIQKQLEKIAEKYSGEIQDEHVICQKCKSRLTFILPNGKPVKTMCECEKEEEMFRLEKLHKEEELKKIEKLKSLSLIDEEYKNVSFKNTQIGTNAEFDYAYRRCMKFYEVFDFCLEHGHGIYLYGDVGVGKTHLTACIANELFSRQIPILFTSLSEISKAIKATFNKNSIETEKSLLEKFSKVDLLFFDDLGTEIFTKGENDTWLQGLLYDLINKRKGRKKPTVFTSNHSLNELINERGIAKKTVDRIMQMTDGAVIKITGKSRRKDNPNRVKPIF